MAETPGRSLVLAHRDELIEQAVEKLALVDDSLDVGVVKAKHVTKRKARKGRRQAAHASVPAESTRLVGPVAAEAAGAG